eukprot:CAMPEP_0185730912 /NCGR_PEP_ID=MMETSP1171-20130828/11382_1 /TAXON_ID=374046 /ORGANISM="Helicotheca tamensis, Strain CCMP826" /LENGTH=150 /DNA_ID=CAMNT_0028400061 /DNA_START=68 /DNA_END=520 /DNA_ORIENTATION=-
MASNKVLFQLYRTIQQQQHRTAAVASTRNLFRNSVHHRQFATSVGALTTDEKNKALDSLSKNGPIAWESVDGRDAIKKTYEFTDFAQAWTFMSKSAQLAEEMDHHPEWFNVYNRVEVTLTTHDCSGVSEKDIRMAEKMDEYAHEVLPMRR